MPPSIPSGGASNPKPAAGRRERHHHGDRERDEGRRDQRRLWEVVPGPPIGADDEDDEDLRGHRFQKPRRPELGRPGPR
jgi:hypothetical protein